MTMLYPNLCYKETCYKGTALLFYFSHVTISRNNVYFQQLLNNCFDDIEKFVSRLQQAAEAYKELERRRYERGHRNKRKSAGGELTLSFMNIHASLHPP